LALAYQFGHAILLVDIDYHAKSVEALCGLMTTTATTQDQFGEGSKIVALEKRMAGTHSGVI
jgi:hypothetical protein